MRIRKVNLRHSIVTHMPLEILLTLIETKKLSTYVNNVISRIDEINKIYRDFNRIYGHQEDVILEKFKKLKANRTFDEKYYRDLYCLLALGDDVVFKCFNGIPSLREHYNILKKNENTKLFKSLKSI